MAYLKCMKVTGRVLLPAQKQFLDTRLLMSVVIVILAQILMHDSDILFKAL